MYSEGRAFAYIRQELLIGQVNQLQRTSPGRWEGKSYGEEGTVIDMCWLFYRGDTIVFCTIHA